MRTYIVYTLNSSIEESDVPDQGYDIFLSTDDLQHAVDCLDEFAHCDGIKQWNATTNDYVDMDPVDWKAELTEQEYKEGRDANS